jgi:hypothetical protein
MQIINKPRLAETIAYYDPLLQRYARRLVHDEDVAASIVLEVLESQYELNLLVPGKHLRLVLKIDVLNYCFYYMQIKMFDRKAEKLLSRNHLKLHFTRGALRPPYEN